MYFFLLLPKGVVKYRFLFSRLDVSTTPIYSDVVLFLGQNICYYITYLEKKNPISGLIYEKKLT